LICQLRPAIGDESQTANLGNCAILFRVTGKAVSSERVTNGCRDLPVVFDPSWRRRQGKRLTGASNAGGAGCRDCEAGTRLI
jgi:hypothetical protein